MNNLEDIKNRLAAATPGPWKAFRVSVGGGTTSGVFEPIPGAKGTENYARPITGWFNSHRRAMDSDAQHADAELIAHAPEDIARLVKALEAVTALHEPTCEQSGTNCINEDCRMRICGPCGESHPCPTLTALTEALDS